MTFLLDKCLNCVNVLFLLMLAACAPQEAPLEEIVLIPEPEPTHIRLIFTGDIMVHEKQLEIAQVHATIEEPYNFRHQFEHIIHYLEGDVVVGNFETVLKGSAPYTGYPSFNSPDSLASALQDAHFNVLLLANNHILDYGVSAGLRTDSYLQSLGFTTAGISDSEENMLLPIIEVNGYNIGIINGTYGSNRPIDSFSDSVHVPVITQMDIAADVQNLQSRGADFIIASFHWGAEYVNSPNSSQQALADECFAAGVDIIVGHHPHVLQPMEIITNTEQTQFVAWSLGNLISAQRTLPRERTVILAIDLIAEPEQELHIERVSVMPLWVDMVYGVKARLLPTRYGELSLQATAENALQLLENTEDSLEEISLHAMGEDFVQSMEDALIHTVIEVTEQELAQQREEALYSALLQEISNSTTLQNKLITVHNDIVNFLNLPPADEDGFHTIWQRSSVGSAQDMTF